MFRTNSLLLMLAFASVSVDRAEAQRPMNTAAKATKSPGENASTPRPVDIQPATVKPAPRPVPRAGQSIKVTEQVRPAFIIDPIVNRIEARRGKSLTMEWGITCEGAPATLEIRPIALTQDENGTIFPNEKVPAPKDLELLTPSSVELQPQERHVIQGRLRVPDTNSTFHTFGLLVRDTGQLKTKTDDAKPDGPRVGIKFITQYLLRCDITVQGVRAESASKLLIESGELIEIDGAPWARVFIKNPTEGPIQFGARTQIRASQEAEARPTFPLIMPVRANLDEPERSIGRILAGARIRMESPLSSPIFPGEYYMESSIVGDNRALVTSGFPIAVQEDDYPAQSIATTLAAPGILVSPSQLELSLQRGGNRTAVLTLQNEGARAATLELVPESADGGELSSIGVRPSLVVLEPATSRKVSITLSSSDDLSQHRYARLRIKTTREGEPAMETSPVTVAAIGRSAGTSNIEVDELTWDESYQPPSFVIDVTNSGSLHWPLEAQLVLGDDETGHPQEIRAGFGKWLLPGTTQRLRFRPPAHLPSGKYTAIMRLNPGANAETIIRQLQFELAGAAP